MNVFRRNAAIFFWSGGVVHLVDAEHAAAMLAIETLIIPHASG